MPWISINPDSEPESSRNLAAYIINTNPKTITPEQMADAYNEADEYHKDVPAISDKGDEARVNNFVDSISSFLDDPEEEVEE